MIDRPIVVRVPESVVDVIETICKKRGISGNALLLEWVSACLKAEGYPAPIDDIKELIAMKQPRKHKPKFRAGHNHDRF